MRQFKKAALLFSLVVGAAAYGLWSWMSDDEEPEKSK